jgi:mono/diheme cytochrome c family protein
MTCHGEEGTGSSIAPELQHPPPDHFRWVVRNGLTGAYESAMVALPEAGLTDVQLESILDYLSQLPEPDTDEGLYLDYCANCHGADARGGVARKEIAGKREALEVIREGKGGTDYAARTRYMPSWQSGALDDDVVARIEAYVGGLPE